jgi:hypothetical protein
VWKAHENISEEERLETMLSYYYSAGLFPQAKEVEEDTSELENDSLVDKENNQEEKITEYQAQIQILPKK